MKATSITRRRSGRPASDPGSVVGIGWRKRLWPGFLALLCFALPTALAAAKLKRRVLVIPFDNMASNKNYNWMSDSIAENLKEQLLKTDRLEVMDAALLRKIDPDIRFEKLTDVEATNLAQKFNCEAAIIGRYFVSKKDGKDNALMQAEGVDAITKKSLVIKSEYADVDAEIFDRVQKLSAILAREFDEKLPPISEKDASRDAKLEKLIYRLEHPPKGFFDNFYFKDAKLVPEFDIDTFEYDVFLPHGVQSVAYEFSPWGKKPKLLLREDQLACAAQTCKLAGDESALAITRELSIQEKSAAASATPPTYTFRIHRAAPPGAWVKRWWLNAGYPLMFSAGFFPGNTKPEALAHDGGLVLDAMRGFGALDAGIVSGRGQILPWKMEYGVGLQIYAGGGQMPQFSAAYPDKAPVYLLSVGGGPRVLRQFWYGRSGFGIQPYLAFNLHYQRYFRSFTNSYLQTLGINPEVGLTQVLRMKSVKKWQFTLTTALGSFLYQNQNLSYARFALGVDYVVE